MPEVIDFEYYKKTRCVAPYVPEPDKLSLALERFHGEAAELDKDMLEVMEDFLHREQEAGRNTFGEIAEALDDNFSEGARETSAKKVMRYSREIGLIMRLFEEEDLNAADKRIITGAGYMLGSFEDRITKWITHRKNTTAALPVVYDYHRWQKMLQYQAAQAQKHGAPSDMCRKVSSLGENEADYYRTVQPRRYAAGIAQEETSRYLLANLSRPTKTHAELTDDIRIAKVRDFGDAVYNSARKENLLRLSAEAFPYRFEELLIFEHEYDSRYTYVE